MKINSDDKWKEFSLRTSELGSRRYILRCTIISRVPIEFELLKEGRRVIATFEGYNVERNDYIRFVIANPIAVLELSSHDRAAVEYALSLLNSDEMVEI